jgi:hypothetical protein
MSYQFKRCPDSCLNDMEVGNTIDLFGNVQNKYGILKLFQIILFVCFHNNYKIRGIMLDK